MNWAPEPRKPWTAKQWQIAMWVGAHFIVGLTCVWFDQLLPIATFILGGTIGDRIRDKWVRQKVITQEKRVYVEVPAAPLSDEAIAHSMEAANSAQGLEVDKPKVYEDKSPKRRPPASAPLPPRVVPTRPIRIRDCANPNCENKIHTNAPEHALVFCVDCERHPERHVAGPNYTKFAGMLNERATENAKKHGRWPWQAYRDEDGTPVCAQTNERYVWNEKTQTWELPSRISDGVELPKPRRIVE